MSLYKSKPVLVDAMQFFHDRESMQKFHKFIGNASFKMLSFSFWENGGGRKFTMINRCLNIFDGDYIIRDEEKGWIHMSKEDFEERYELA